MGFTLDDITDIEVSFVEKKDRGSDKFKCYIELTVGPNLSCPCQMICPLGDNWEQVKKRYPEFIDIIKEIHGYHEICREVNEIKLLKVVGDKGLYDIDIAKWNSNLRK
jgi:hypothetical protein